jgi:hypothetical protein
MAISAPCLAARDLLSGINSPIFTVSSGPSGFCEAFTFGTITTGIANIKQAGNNNFNILI